MNTLKNLTGLTLCLGLTAGAAQAELQNPDFEDYRLQPEGDINYMEDMGPPAWFVQDGPEGFDVVTDPDLGSPGGANVLRTGELGTGFGANKLEQCVPVDAEREMAIDYLAFTPDAPEGLSIRINPNFYSDMATCVEGLRTDDSGNRLSGGDNNADLDVDLEDVLDSNEWVRVTEFNGGTPMVYGPAGSGAALEFPEGTQAMLLSVRFRDRADDGDAAGFTILMDDIRVVQEGSPANLVINGDFSHTQFVDGDFVTGDDDGWFLDRWTDFPAAIGPAWFALEGPNVYYSEGQDGGFGNSKIDQCFDLAGVSRLAPEFFVRTDVPAEDLAGRLALEIYDGPDCGGSELADLEANFAAFGAADAPEAGRWYSLLTASPVSGDAIDVDLDADFPEAQSAFISLRVRDRSDAGDNGPTANIPRPVYIDDVNLFSLVSTPVALPLPGDVSAGDEDEFDVTLTSDTSDVTIIYTLDGSIPDPEDEDALSVSNGGAVTVTGDTVLRAVALGTNMDQSSVRTAAYGDAGAIEDGDVPAVGDNGGSGSDDDGSRSVSSGSSGSLPGCSVSGGGVTDPMLGLLLALALMGLFWRRRNV